MNVDEAMALAKELRVELDGEQEPGMYLSEIAAIVLAAEVERLRAEVQRLDIAGIHSCHDDCQKLPCVQRREIERLRAELRAAKAASVCPVRVMNIFEGTYQSPRYIELRTDAEADTFTDWLRDRMKERGKG